MSNGGANVQADIDSGGRYVYQVKANNGLKFSPIIDNTSVLFDSNSVDNTLYGDNGSTIKRNGANGICRINSDDSNTLLGNNTVGLNTKDTLFINIDYTKDGSTITSYNEKLLRDGTSCDMWVNSANLNNNHAYHSAIGLTDNNMVMGGCLGNSATYIRTTEIYNGSIWNSGPNINAYRMMPASVGTCSSGIIMGGGNSNVLNTTEVYNGSIWYNSTNMNSNRMGHSSVGITNNSMVMGGSNSSTNLNTTEVYNGSIWSNSTNMNSVRHYHSSVGITNNSMVMGGYNSGTAINSTEVYNGSVWSSGPKNIANNINSPSAVGTVNDGMLMGGSGRQDTEKCNGTFWYAGIRMNRQRYNYSSAGSVSDCMVMGSISYPNTTEKYKFADYSAILYGLETNPNRVWKNSISMNHIRADHTSVGTTDDCMVIGGYTHYDTTEVYNGSVWVNSTNINMGKQRMSGVGVTNNSMITGGSNSNGNGYLDSTEKYNGSVWVNSTNMNIGRGLHSSVGITNNSMVMGGYDPHNNTLNTTEVYNGSIWSNSTNMNSSRNNHTSVGITNNSMVMGGWSGSGSTNTTEVYNGSIWSNSTNMNSSRHWHTSVGITNDCTVMGGRVSNSTILNTTEVYNGSIWSNSTNMNSVRIAHSSVGITNNSMVMGGTNGSTKLNTTEILQQVSTSKDILSTIYSSNPLNFYK